MWRGFKRVENESRRVFYKGEWQYNNINLPLLHSQCVMMCVCVCNGCTFESEIAKKAAPAASFSRWKAPFSAALITVSAALLGSDRPVPMQPTRSSLTLLPSSATESSDPQSATVPLFIDPQSVTVKGDAVEPHSSTTSPLISQGSCFLLIINQHHWQHWSSITP